MWQDDSPGVLVWLGSAAGCLPAKLPCLTARSTPLARRPRVHLLLFLLLAILNNAELPTLNCSEKGKTVKSRSANEG